MTEAIALPEGTADHRLTEHERAQFESDRSGNG